MFRKTKNIYLNDILLQLFKRRNVATVEDDGIPEDDGMADSGYLESQANNMDPLMVRRERSIEPVKNNPATLLHSLLILSQNESIFSVFYHIFMSLLHRVGSSQKI